jgi:hypothetical protein
MGTSYLQIWKTVSVLVLRMNFDRIQFQEISLQFCLDSYTGLKPEFVMIFNRGVISFNFTCAYSIWKPVD